MPTVLPIKKGVQLRLIADKTLEAHSVAQALADAQYTFELKRHDLRTKFIASENELRDEFLARVAEIQSEE